MIKTKTIENDIQKGQKAPAAAIPQAVPVKVPPLFRRIDWLAMALTFVGVWVTYMMTLAPELTLEDSGELVTGSFYAGIPHPPGYPVWTIYSWLWTALLPMGNMAWRVAVGEATSGAFACGLLALLVSRGSSMFMEGIEELKGMTGKWESSICLISGCVAGLLVGLDGFMWGESVVVNRIAVFSVPWFLMLLACLLRWIYAPHQWRYAYLAAFMFGVCITTHQSLLTAAIGFEIVMAAGNLKMGRDTFLGNFVVYMTFNIIFLVSGQWVFSNLGRPGMQVLFHSVGIGSLLAGLWLSVRTKGILSEWKHVIIMALLFFLGVSFYVYEAISGMTNPPMQWGYPRTVEGFFHALSRGQYEQPNPTNVLMEPARFAGQIGMLISGLADEFTWVYILFAIVPFVFLFKMKRRERAWLIGLTGMYFSIGVLLMVLMNPTPERASADLIKVFFNSSHTIVACLIGYGLALTAAFMATHYQQFRLWGLLGGACGVVLAVYELYLATDKSVYGPGGGPFSWKWIGWISNAFAANHYGAPVIAGLILLGIAFVFVAALVAYQKRGPLLITLCLFAAMPLYSAVAHYWSSSQRGHMFGYWFGHDMFTPPFKGADGKPLFPEMTKDAVLYGGTDPGRFCPTYMIFTESFTPHKCQPEEDQKFDRRDVYIITQNALADGTYLNYIRAHYNRSEQIDPPFFSELMRTVLKDREYQTNILARMARPLDRFFTDLGDRVEKRRRTFTSWFTESDFTDLPALTAKLRKGEAQDPVSKYIYDNLSPATQQLLSGSGDDARLRKELAADLNRLIDRECETKKALDAIKAEKDAVDQDLAYGGGSDSARKRQAKLAAEIEELSRIGSLYTPERFKQVTISEYLQDFIAQNPQSHTRVRLNRLLLEAAYPKEIAKSLGGVYPDREIYIATPEDSQRCFQEYLADAQKRLTHDAQFPNEPRQIKPGEDVKVVDQRVQVSGQVAVMAINGLLTKVMFDHNPKNEFFVEESFPLDWMYPHLTPYGIIMKINRKPLPELTEDILQKDHDFWKQFSKRLCGDFIDYNTSVKDVTDWIEKTYVRFDFNGYTGDRKFIHDNDAQKAFSKLRSSIGGIYAWRLSPQCPPEYRPKSNVEMQRLVKEADFAFRQALAFCPYSPEAVFRYANLLLQFNRLDEALLVAQACLKLDPYNAQVMGLVQNLQSYRKQTGALDPNRGGLLKLEEEVQKSPSNFAAAFELASAYMQLQQMDKAIQVLDGVLASPAADYAAVLGVAQAYISLKNAQKLEVALEKLVKVAPDKPESWYDLAAMKSDLGKTGEAVTALSRSLDLSNQRLKSDPKASNLLARAQTETRFAPLKQMPEFQKLVAAH
jgi:tetratricopeptide (TPR) repeat protein